MDAKRPKPGQHTVQRPLGKTVKTTTAVKAKSIHTRNTVFPPLPDWKDASCTSSLTPSSIHASKAHTELGCRCTACKDLPLALTPTKPVPLKRQPFKVGDRVILSEDLTGVIKWFGLLDEYAPGQEIYVGVHLDDPVGEHDGMFGKKRFFRCPQYHGTIVAKKDVLLVKGRNDLSYRSTTASPPRMVPQRAAPAPTKDKAEPAQQQPAAKAPALTEQPASAQSKARKLLEAQAAAQEEYEQQQRNPEEGRSEEEATEEGNDDGDDGDNHHAVEGEGNHTAEREGAQPHSHPVAAAPAPRAAAAAEEEFTAEEVHAAREQLKLETQEACRLLELQELKN